MEYFIGAILGFIFCPQNFLHTMVINPRMRQWCLPCDARSAQSDARSSSSETLSPRVPTSMTLSVSQFSLLFQERMDYICLATESAKTFVSVVTLVGACDAHCSLVYCIFMIKLLSFSSFVERFSGLARNTVSNHFLNTKSPPHMVRSLLYQEYFNLIFKFHRKGANFSFVSYKKFCNYLDESSH